MTYLLRFSACLFLCVSLNSFGALSIRDLDGDLTNGHEGVYDDVLDITWLADANLAGSNTFGVSGAAASSGGMAWDTSERFIDAMNTVTYLGLTNWRQPRVAPVNGNSFNTTLTYDGGTDVGYQLSAPVNAANNPNGKSAGVIVSELAYHYYNNFEAIGSSYGDGATRVGSQTDNVYGIDNAADPNNYKIDLFNDSIENWFYWTSTKPTTSTAFVFGQLDGYQADSFSGSSSGTFYVWPVHDGDIGGSPVPLPAGIYLFLSGLVGLGLMRGRND